jgi:hypothetical protein
VRIIDWGFSRSDHVFGPGDIRTCLSIESVKRIHFGNGLLWPCECYDMACVLVDLMDRLKPRQQRARQETSEWLASAMDLLKEHAREHMGQSLEEMHAHIQRTGLYPLKFSEITGNTLTRWLAALMENDAQRD